MRPRRIVTGEYGVNGYTVTLCSSRGVHVMYSAGNNPRDSQQCAAVGVGLRRMRGYCMRTSREIAQERRAEYGGVTRVAEEEQRE